MLEGISLAALGDIGSSGLLVLVVILLLWGKLVPVSSVNREQKKYDDALARSETVISTQAQAILEFAIAANNTANVATSLAHRTTVKSEQPPAEGA